MRILYISTVFPRLENSATIYTDLAEELALKGHKVFVLAAEEKKKYKDSGILNERGCRVFRTQIGNMYDVNIIEKGISILTLSYYMKRAIKKYLAQEEFDLILFEAPPLTLASVVAYAKKKYKALAYLMMKDIFPQNAVDIGIMKKGLVYSFFKHKEKKMYRTADIIGCMSEGNRKYIEQHNKVPKDKLKIFPNTKKIQEIKILNNNYDMRKKYNIPKDRIVFIFGGNMGKPQGIPFLCKAVKELENKSVAYFVFVGRGTEKRYLENELENCTNVTVLENLAREEYEKLVLECDVGLVSLDYRFSIPNYPSRVLSYMEYGMPILATTDKNTDFKELIEQAECGLWCYSDSVEEFCEAVDNLVSDSQLRDSMGTNGRRYAERYFDVAVSVELLEKHLQ